MIPNGLITAFSRVTGYGGRGQASVSARSLAYPVSAQVEALSEFARAKLEARGVEASRKVRFARDLFIASVPDDAAPEPGDIITIDPYGRGATRYIVVESTISPRPARGTFDVQDLLLREAPTS